MCSAPGDTFAFAGLLFDRVDVRDQALRSAPPDCLTDLCLDQVIETIMPGEQEPAKAFFYCPQPTIEAITARQQLLRDIEQPFLFDAFQTFCTAIGRVRNLVAQAGRTYYRRAREARLLDAAQTYFATVRELHRRLCAAQLHATRLRTLRQCLTGYVESAWFRRAEQAEAQTRAQLREIRYCVRIKGQRVHVFGYEGEADFSATVADLFTRLHPVRPTEFPESPDETSAMDHVQAAILDRVARLYPRAFSALDMFCSAYPDLLGPGVERLDADLRFCLACLRFVQDFRAAGFAWCYPEVVQRPETVYASGSFDPALAHRLRATGNPIVRNDFHLSPAERLIVLTGPNQGGKTTFATLFGQLHYLAGLGLPVPATAARLARFDRIHTHFGRREHLADLRGGLESELRHLHRIAETATPDSIVILNEAFSSTSTADAVSLGTRFIRLLLARRVLGVYVTFLDELAAEDTGIVSMIAEFDTGTPPEPSYRIRRGPPCGRLHASMLAARHRLSYRDVIERIAR